MSPGLLCIFFFFPSFTLPETVLPTRVLSTLFSCSKNWFIVTSEILTLKITPQPPVSYVLGDLILCRFVFVSYSLVIFLPRSWPQCCYTVHYCVHYSWCCWCFLNRTVLRLLNCRSKSGVCSAGLFDKSLWVHLDPGDLQKDWIWRQLYAWFLQWFTEFWESASCLDIQLLASWFVQVQRLHKLPMWELRLWETTCRCWISHLGLDWHSEEKNTWRATALPIMRSQLWLLCQNDVLV